MNDNSSKKGEEQHQFRQKRRPIAHRERRGVTSTYKEKKTNNSKKGKEQ